MSVQVLCIGDVMLDVIARIEVAPERKLTTAVTPQVASARAAAELQAMLLLGSPALMHAAQSFATWEMILPVRQ